MGHKEKSNMFLSSLAKSLTEEKLIGQSAGLAWGNSCWLVDLALGCWNDGNHGPDWGHDLVTKGTLLQSPTKKQNPVSTDP